MSRTTTQNATPEVKTNPRTLRSREALRVACDLIRAELSDGEWHSSSQIHRKFGKRIAEGMFGRVKSELGIVHRRVKSSKGKAHYEWQLPKASR